MITKRVIAVLLLFFTLPFVLPEKQPALAGAEEYFFRRSWGAEGNQFNFPQGIAVGADNQIIVANTHFHRLTLINQNNRTFESWGQNGSDPGEFYYPSGLAVDSLKNIYVVDYGNSRVQKFSRDGLFLLQWGSNGSGDGQFDHPQAVAVDSYNNVYVVDENNHRIQKFSSNGIYITQWGSEGTGNGQFSSPTGIAIDPNNLVYVADAGNRRIAVFSSSGSFIQQWPVVDSSSNLQYPRNIAAGDNNRIYVTTPNVNSILVYDQAGSLVRQIRDEGLMMNPWAITMDRESDRLYVTTINGVVKLDANGGFITDWTNQPSMIMPHSVAVDNSGNVFVLATASVHKYSAAGSELLQFGSTGSGQGQFSYPARLTVDENGYVYVADMGNDRIQVFSNNGQFVREWGSYGSSTSQFDSPGDIIIGIDGNLLIADIGNQRIQKFSKIGSYLGTIPASLGSGNAYAYLFGSGIATDNEGYLYHLDGDDFLRKISPNGNLIQKWGSQGATDTPFDFPGDVSISGGKVFVSENNGSKIQTFSQDGAFLGSIGGPGSGVGEFMFPDSFSFDPSGNLYVADTYNERVQEFALGLPPIDLYTGLVGNGSFETLPAFTEWAHGGSLPVSLSNASAHGQYSAQLGLPVSATSQGDGEAWLHTTFYVRPEWDRPMLSFKYNMVVNDIMDYSDFFVAVQDALGLNHLATVIRDGFQPCTPGVPPSPGTSLGWRTASYDLSAYKGQHIRLVFSNRNLWPESWGIWTYVDDVRVIDAGPLPTPPGVERVFLPLLSRQRCDPVPASAGDTSLSPSFRPLLP